MQSKGIVSMKKKKIHRGLLHDFLWGLASLPW